VRLAAVNVEQPANIEDMFVTEAQVNVDGKVVVVKLGSLVQPENIEAVVVRTVELNFARVSVTRFEQFWNIDDISFTFVVAKLEDQVMPVSAVHPLNIEAIVVTLTQVKLVANVRVERPEQPSNMEAVVSR